MPLNYRSLCCNDATHLAENQNDLGDHSNRHDPHDVAGDEEEGLLCGGAKAVPEDGRLYVGVFVEELHALLQAPEAALHAAQNRLSTAVWYKRHGTGWWVGCAGVSFNRGEASVRVTFLRPFHIRRLT